MNEGIWSTLSLCRELQLTSVTDAKYLTTFYFTSSAESARTLYVCSCSPAATFPQLKDMSFTHSPSFEAKNWLHSLYMCFVNSNTTGEEETIPKPKNPAAISTMLPLPPIDLNDVQHKLATHFRPWQRSFQFWARAVDIYTGYKVTLFLTFSLNVCMLIHFNACNGVKGVFVDLGWWVLLGLGRCFSCVWVSWRMWRDKRKCGRGNMKLRLRRYMLCVRIWAVSFSRLVLDELMVCLLNWF